MSKGVTRWLAWLEAVEKAVPSDFPRLARLAQDNPAALRMVAARWAEVAPRHMYDCLVAASRGPAELPIRELWNILVKEWTKRDPEAVIAALNNPEDFGMRTHWRVDVASAVFGQDVERGLRLMAEWHIENFGPSMSAVAKWAQANPAHATQFVLQNRAGYATELTMETIGREWGKTDPAAALAFAGTKPGGLETTLASSALKQWAQTDLRAAANWLGQADAATQDRLSPAFVEAWAKIDATNALGWCQQSLTGSGLVKAVGAVLQGVAAKDVSAAAALVAAMAPSPARAQAAEVVAKQWFPGLSSDTLVTPDMVTWLGGLDPVSLKRVIDGVHWGWATSDPNTMAAFLANSSGEGIPDIAYTLLAGRLAHQNPAQALMWAEQLPSARAVSAGSAAFAEWWDSQPNAANQWLGALPPSDPRRQPYFQGAVRALVARPQAAQQLTALSPSDRAAVREVIESMTLPSERRAPLLRALEAP